MIDHQDILEKWDEGTSNSWTIMGLMKVILYIFISLLKSKICIPHNEKAALTGRLFGNRIAGNFYRNLNSKPELIQRPGCTTFPLS